jgi:pteridine reductase
LDTRVAGYDRQHVAYHLSKQMLCTLTRMMAVEFAPRIRVNAVAPGLILPPEGKGMDYLEGLKGTNPLNQYGSAEDISAAAVFLIGSAFITGQGIHVDGGRHLKGMMD